VIALGYLQSEAHKFEFFVNSERAKKELYLQQRVGYLDKIKECEKSANKEELLDAWCSYISWARQSLLSGGQSGEYAVILNDCIRKFSSKELMKEFRENYQVRLPIFAITTSCTNFPC
jgi:hypothetical protein